MNRDQSQLKLLIAVLFMIALGLVARPVSSWTDESLQKKDAKARELFTSIILVLKHPRCLKCNACHPEQNVAGLNMPPGVPNWHLPPARMPMIWEGKTPGEICRQIKDPKQNNGKSIAQIVEHVTSDKLVMWGWNPGEGRAPVPMPHDEFARRFQDWARLGAACPE